MRVIITGGTGLVGRALTERLAGDGHEVIVLSRRPDKAAPMPAGVQVVAWDARTATGWGHLADGAHAIVNLAGASIAGHGFFPVRWSAERRQLLRDSRLYAGAAVSAAVAAAAQKPAVVLQSSAVGYYGPRQDEKLDESAAPGDDFLAQICHRDWEVSTASVVDHGVRQVIMRLGLVLSVTDGALPRLLLQHRLFAGGPFGHGRQWYSWIHLEDAVEAMYFLMTNRAAAGAFNLTAPNPVRNREFSRTLGRVLRRPSLIPVPGFVMRLLFGEVATVVLEGQRVLPARLQALDFQFRFPEAEAALHDLIRRGV